MKKSMAFLVVFITILSFTSLVLAGTFTFWPSDPDLDDLDHRYYYTWGIDWTIPSGEFIVSASLFFNDIRNWQTEPNHLYAHLLDTVATTPTDVRKYWDNQGGGDNFSGQGLFLFDWTLPSYAQDLTYDFDVPLNKNEINTLTAYLADGNFGFGFDPDCHYYNKWIKFTVETAVPEPSSIILLLAGLVSLAGLGLKKKM